MKKIFFTLVIAALAVSCKQTPSTGNFGETITPDGALTVEEFISAMGDKTEYSGKIKGTVVKVCQSEGCWYTLDMPNGETMRVVTKDHKFTLPKDASGKTAVASGTAKVTVTSVEELQHLAQDEKKSPEEIAAITEPQREIEFEADGVIIQ